MSMCISNTYRYHNLKKKLYLAFRKKVVYNICKHCLVQKYLVIIYKLSTGSYRYSHPNFFDLTFNKVGSYYISRINCIQYQLVIEI